MNQITEWQPIETAPRDGTQILLYQRWKDDTLLRSAIDLGVWDSEKKAWNCHLYNIDDPSHWMPIPKEPEILHDCKHVTCGWRCFSDPDHPERFVLVDYRDIWSYVIACPFCGEMNGEEQKRRHS